MKNIIFDVGGVLVGYRWMDMFREAGMDEKKAREIGWGFFGCRLWPDYDAGLVTTEELLQSLIAEKPELEADYRWFVAHAEEMTVKRPAIWELVKKLKEKGYGIYLLSNYSEELFTRHMKGMEFMELIDGGIVSYQVHEIKPNPPIYRILLEKYGLKAEECLFFDDRADNTEAAKKLGMEAVTVVDASEEFLKKELEKLLQI